MAGKGSEIGRNFEELARIYDGVVQNDKLRVCFDTCHTSDSGYDIIHHFDDVMESFDRLLGKDQIAVFHINDSKIFQEPRKTGMKISALEKSVLMQFLQLSITRISNLYQRSLRLLIFLL